MQSKIQKEFHDHIAISKTTLENVSGAIENAALMCIDCLNKGGKIILFGNGGSAADAQHIAAELVGRYKTSRKGLPAISLTTDSSIVTSISNDFGFENVFLRQIEALANKGDVVIGISTGGTSKNVIDALKLGKTVGCEVIGLSGKDGGEMNTVCNINIVVPSNDTPRIQEMHILIGHTLCHLIDLEFTN